MKLLTISEARLADLLRTAGVNKSPAEYLTESSDEVRAIAHLHSRARAAFWSRFWLLATTAFAFLSLVASGPNIEDGLTLILCGGMTAVEFKVHKWFLEGDPRAPAYGYANQTLFAVLFLIYGTFHYFTVQTPPMVAEVMGAEMVGVYLSTAKITYAAIGIVGACGQYWLAVFYRRSWKKIDGSKLSRR